MTGSHDDTAFHRWRNALLEALDSPDAIMAWQDHRYQFAHELGELLAGAADPDIAPITGHAVYGIYVAGGGLLYVGQTANAKTTAPRSATRRESSPCHDGATGGLGAGAAAR